VSQRLAAQPPLGETPAAATEELDLVVSLLRRLPTKLRDVILLVGVFDLSYEEAGRALRIPVGTVASRLAAGRRRLASSPELRRRDDREGRTSAEDE
jgi:RNA polymerase sigma-70 factor (ECF subfamily)